MREPETCERCGDELYDYEGAVCDDCHNQYYSDDDGEDSDDDEL